MLNWYGKAKKIREQKKGKRKGPARKEKVRHLSPLVTTLFLVLRTVFCPIILYYILLYFILSYP